MERPGKNGKFLHILCMKLFAWAVERLGENKKFLRLHCTTTQHNSHAARCEQGRVLAVQILVRVGENKLI